MSQETGATTLLEKSAVAVTGDLFPNAAVGTGADAASPNIQQILQIVLSVLTTVTQNCPQPPAKLAQTMKAPNLLQKTALMMACRDACNCCGDPQTRRLAGAMSQSILERAAKLSDEEATQIIGEARNFDNLLI